MGFSFDERVAQLAAFLAERGEYPKKSDEKQLVKWISNQREAYKASKLPDARKEKLEALPGWQWSGSSVDPFPGKLAELTAFLAEHGEYPKRNGDRTGERQLAQWINNHRKAFKGTGRAKLTDERKEQLEALPGWQWSGSSVDPFPEKFAELTTFLAEHGEYPKKNGDRDGERPLAQWVGNQRTAFKSKGGRKITDERVAALEALPGWDWGADKPEGDPFSEKFEELTAFLAERGQYPKQSAESAEERTLAKWMSNQREAHKASRLTDARKERLEALPGWQWAADRFGADPFPGKLAELTAFLAEHGEYPKRYGSRNGETQLAQWINGLRRAFKGTGRAKLTDERKQKLEALPGWKWEADRFGDDPFPGKLAELTAFLAEHGEYPKRNGDRKGETQLCQWINGLQRSYQGNRGGARVTEERRERLETLPGWKWRTPAAPSRKRSRSESSTDG